MRDDACGDDGCGGGDGGDGGDEIYEQEQSFFSFQTRD